MADFQREKLIELKTKFVESFECGDCTPANDKCRKCLTEKETDYLLKNGVIVPPCKVGDTLYRIDYRIKRCSLHHMYSKGNEYYCGEDYNCFLYDTPACDCGEEYYIYEIKTQNIETIVCNMRQLGKTVFLTREEAEKALAERQVKNG